MCAGLHLFVLFIKLIYLLKKNKIMNLIYYEFVDVPLIFLIERSVFHVLGQQFSSKILWLKMQQAYFGLYGFQFFIAGLKF